MDKLPEVTITMTVDVNSLESDPVVKNSVNILDNLNDRDDVPGDSSTFDTVADSHSKIYWKAQSMNGVDTIHIDLIYINKGQPDPFQDPPGELVDGSGEWFAIAKDVGYYQDIDSEYSIRFYVNGNHKKKYTIDPKLQIRKKLNS
ncbi:hypothetical protein [Winogradskyella sp. 3972H.M.0a.05]|uniref:hypothetical protein n=1 Tax=Winogradskyella sp. 3972H.M.0a.05 TaxID=2950277 RepID=UPI00339417BD